MLSSRADRSNGRVLTSVDERVSAQIRSIHSPEFVAGFLEVQPQWECGGRPLWLWVEMRWCSSPASCTGSTWMTAPFR